MGDNVVDVFARLKKVFGAEQEEKQLVEAFTEVEKEFEEAKEEFEEIKKEVIQEEEPEVKEEMKVREPFPIEVGDILYVYDLLPDGEPAIQSYPLKVEVNYVDEENGIITAESTALRGMNYYREDTYKFSIKDMIRLPFGYYTGDRKERALTYREKLVAENNMWRGKPKAGDIFYGKRFTESDGTYGTLTWKYKVLGVTPEVFSAAPINKDNEPNEALTLIFDTNTLFEVALHGTTPIQLFTTQDNAHTAYLHKQIEKKNREAK